MDWNLLLSQARAFEWSSAVYPALSQSIAFFNTPIPQDVLKDLSRESDRNQDRVATLQAQPSTHTFEEIQKLKTLDGNARWKLLLALIAPTPAYMRWRYGLKTPQALPAYYLHRWWQILKDAARTIGFLVRKFIVPANPLGLEIEKARKKTDLL
jgi:hypothetical protein